MSDADVAVWRLEPGEVVPPLAGEGAVLRQVQVPAGTKAARHSHEHEQFLIVTAGSGTLLCAAGEVVLAPGTIIRLAPGAWHSAVFTAATVLIEVNMRLPRS
jgi:quercetin dioxygenase-like cupin family protein